MALDEVTKAAVLAVAQASAENIALRNNLHKSAYDCGGYIELFERVKADGWREWTSHKTQAEGDASVLDEGFIGGHVGRWRAEKKQEAANAT